MPSRRRTRNSSTRARLSPEINDFGHSSAFTPFSAPDRSRWAASLRWKKAASPCLFQTVPSTGNAVPPGPVGKLEVERDDQFFLSVSLSPHSAFTAFKAS